MAPAARRPQRRSCLPRLVASQYMCLYFKGVVHGAGSEAAAAAHQLREEVRDAVSRLGRQLFDRNSQRALAPAAAFAVESVQVCFIMCLAPVH